MKDGAFALLSPPWGIWQVKSPRPREFAIQGGAEGGGSGRRWSRPFYSYGWKRG